MSFDHLSAILPGLDLTSRGGFGRAGRTASRERLRTGRDSARRGAHAAGAGRCVSRSTSRPALVVRSGLARIRERSRPVPARAIVMLIVLVLCFLWQRPKQTRRLIIPALIPAIVVVQFVLPGTIGTIRSSFFPEGGLDRPTVGERRGPRQRANRRPRPIAGRVVAPAGARPGLQHEVDRTRAPEPEGAMRTSWTTSG